MLPVLGLRDGVLGDTRLRGELIVRKAPRLLLRPGVGRCTRAGDQAALRQSGKAGGLLRNANSTLQQR